MSLGLPRGNPSEFGMSEEHYWRIRNIFDVQSITFACEILPCIYDLYAGESVKITMLDVGSRTGAGTGLIGYLHQEFAFSRMKIAATALDTDAQYQKYASKHYPYIKYIVGDIFDPAFDVGYDLVICSHTIEHIPEPHRFIDRLISIAKSYVIIACPFEEQDLLKGHVNRIDGDFFSNYNLKSIRVYDSVAWTRSKACIAVLSRDDI